MDGLGAKARAGCESAVPHLPERLQVAQKLQNKIVSLVYSCLILVFLFSSNNPHRKQNGEQTRQNSVVTHPPQRLLNAPHSGTMRRRADGKGRPRRTNRRVVQCPRLTS